MFLQSCECNFNILLRSFSCHLRRAISIRALRKAKQLISVSCSFVLLPLRWLGTVVTSHTASNWPYTYTPVMSMLQKAVQSTHCKSHCTSCNQPAHTNVIMLYAVKCSLYVVGPFLWRTLHESWSTGGENVTKLLGVPKRTQ